MDTLIVTTFLLGMVSGIVMFSMAIAFVIALLKKFAEHAHLKLLRKE